MRSKQIAVIGLYGMSALFRLERLPAEGETVGSVGLCFEGGGKGYNQALGALRAGGEVFFATAGGGGRLWPAGGGGIPGRRAAALHLLAKRPGGHRLCRGSQRRRGAQHRHRGAGSLCPGHTGPD